MGLQSWTQLSDCMNIYMMVTQSLFFGTFFDMDHFKNLYWICFNIPSVFCFGFLAWSHVGLCSPIRDGALIPATGRWSLNQWTTRKAPPCPFLVCSNFGHKSIRYFACHYGHRQRIKKYNACPQGAWGSWEKNSNNINMNKNNQTGPGCSLDWKFHGITHWA